MKEKDYYPKIMKCLSREPFNLITDNPFVEGKWKEKGFINAGLLGSAGAKGLISDIVGLRKIVDQWGYTDIEIWAIEVKPKYNVYKPAVMSQAKGAALFAHKTYLAVPRDYTKQEKEIALEFQIGLLFYDETNDTLLEIVPSPRNIPDPMHKFRVLVNLGYRLCMICNRWYPLPETDWGRLGNKNKFWSEPITGKELRYHLCNGCVNLIKKIAGKINK